MLLTQQRWVFAMRWKVRRVTLHISGITTTSTVTITFTMNQQLMLMARIFLPLAIITMLMCMWYFPAFCRAPSV
jgi:hypothetical protein